MEGSPFNDLRSFEVLFESVFLVFSQNSTLTDPVGAVRF